VKQLRYILIVILCICCQATAFALPNNNDKDAKAKTNQYIKYVYDKLSFKKMQRLSFDAFSKAYYGYLNLKEAGKISGNAPLAICDFSLSSNVKRFWVVDVQRKKILFNTLVAHGMGTGEEYATKFSNIQDSHQSSLGFYTTGETYMGDNGYSLKLHGQDGVYNSNAFERAIVMHGADYVSTSFAGANNRIGRSHGCPALPREVNEAVLSKIQNGAVLFIYHPTKAYLKSSYWLNNNIAHLPAEADYVLDMLQPKNTNPKWVEYGTAKDSINNTRSITKQIKIGDSSTSTKAIIAKPILESKLPIQQPAPSKQDAEIRKEFLYIK
jgi:hypothetical protein